MKRALPVTNSDLWLELIFGMKQAKSGPISWPVLFEKQGTRFVNFPIDKDGKQVPFSHPDFMRDDDLFLWRDHIIESFREREEGEAPYERAFRFLDMKGREPTLTLLNMGTTTRETKKKPTAKTRAKKASSPSIKAQVKSQKKVTKSKRVVVSESEVSSAGEDDDEEENSEEDYDALDHEEDPPKSQKQPRPKPRPARDAVDKGRDSLAAQVADEARQEQAELDTKAKQAQQRRDLQDGKKLPCPGNGPQKKEFDGSRLLKDSEGEPVLFLTRPSMRTGTLPPDWRSPNWDPETVSGVFSVSCTFRSVWRSISRCLRCANAHMFGAEHAHEFEAAQLALTSLN